MILNKSGPFVFFCKLIFCVKSYVAGKHILLETNEKLISKHDSCRTPFHFFCVPSPSKPSASAYIYLNLKVQHTKTHDSYFTHTSR